MKITIQCRIALGLLALVAFLSGCAGYDSMGDRQVQTQGKVRALREQLPLRNYKFVSIDRASSDLAASSSQARGSQQSESEKMLTRLILSQPCQALAVSGDDDANAAQALLSALNQVAASPSHAQGCPVAFVGAPNEFIDLIAQAALRIRVRFDWVRYPK